MRSTKLRAFTAASAFAILLTSISCGSGSAAVDGTTAAGTSESVSGETARLYPSFDKTYDGRTVHILSFDNGVAYSWANLVNDIDVETLNGSILNDAVYERNAVVESLLDIVIEGIPSDHENIADLVYKDVASGDGAYDIVTADMAISLSSLISKQCLIDLKTLEGLDLDAPWWNAECTESLELFGKLYAGASDMIYQDKLATIVTYYNKVLAEDFKVSGLPELALSGGWTYDKMIEYSKNVYADLNQNDTPDKDDRYGIICQNDYAGFMLNSFGISIVDGGKTPSINKSESLIDSLTLIYETMNDNELFANAHTLKVYSAGSNTLFAENRGLFFIRPTHSMFVLREMQADFGILPTPKRDESQESYASPMNTSAAITICVPKSTPDTELTCTVIEALSAESMYELIPDLYEDVLGAQLVRDEVSSDILDIVYAGRFYDIGSIFNLGNWRNTVYTSSAKGIATLIAENESAVTAAIDELKTAVLEG